MSEPDVIGPERESEAGVAESREEIPEHIAWFGRDEPPPARTLLHAGPIRAWLTGGDLRPVRLGRAELAPRIYVAVRDPNSNTIPGVVSNVVLQRGRESFQLGFDCRHRGHEIDYEWRASWTGAADGTLSLAMDGVARRSFRFYRIGFCIHHAIAASAGRPIRLETPTAVVEATMPRAIASMPIRDGAFVPLFPACRALEIDQADDVTVRVEFEGDLFEMEDQRNWGDACFKTFSTPLATGLQVAAAGARFHQRLVLAVRPRAAHRPAAGDRGAAPTADPHPGVGAKEGAPRPGPAPSVSRVVELRLRDLGRPLPRLGLGLASDGLPLSAREVRLLGRLRLDHLRVDLRPWQPTHAAALAMARDQAAALGCGLELALFVTDDADGQLADLAGRLRGAPVARVLVFHEPDAHQSTTGAHWVRLARDRLATVAGGAAFGGGTNGSLAEILRSPPHVGSMDVVSFTANPQMHATDEATLVENLEPLAAMVEAARAACGSSEIAISRLTLRPPFNQWATEPEPPSSAADLPASVDPRQMSLFGACWTLAALQRLAEGGASSVTLYETAGMTGIMERQNNASAPGRFPSRPGMVFPMYHVLADLTDRRAGHLVDCVSSEPALVAGLAMRLPGASLVLVANLTPEPCRATVGPLPSGPKQVRVLDAQTAATAMFLPERFRAAWGPVEARGDRVELRLAPYASVALRVGQPSG